MPIHDETTPLTNDQSDKQVAKKTVIINFWPDECGAPDLADAMKVCIERVISTLNASSDTHHFTLRMECSQNLTVSRGLFKKRSETMTIFFRDFTSGRFIDDFSVTKPMVIKRIGRNKPCLFILGLAADDIDYISRRLDSDFPGTNYLPVLSSSHAAILRITPDFKTALEAKILEMTESPSRRSVFSCCR